MNENKDLEHILIESIKNSFIKSYPQIIDYHNHLLSQITEKAQNSIVYKGRIKKISNIEELNELPLTPYEQIYQCIKEFGLEKALIKRPIKYWQTSGHTGESKKFYYSNEDLEKITELGAQIGYLAGGRPGAIFWNLGAGDPYLSGSIGTIIGKKLNAKEIMTNLVAQKDFIKGLKKASKVEKIDFISGIPLVYLSLGQIINNPKAFEQKVQNKISEKLGPLKFLGKPITRIYLRGINYKKIKENLERTKVGFSFAEPIKPHLQNIKHFFPNLKMREAYGSTELVFGGIQLSDNSDISLMLNWFIPEVAPPEEIMRAKQNPNYRVNAIPWYKWEKGMKGELIATRPGECLPLIRYPTGDLIEVINPAETHTIKLNNERVTITLPTVKILGRSTETVDFSTSEEMGIFMGAKLYSRQIKEAMAWVGNNGKIKWWDLYILPPKTTPFTKLRFEIIPEDKIKDENAFKNEVKTLLRRECDELDVVLSKVEENFPNEIIDQCLEIVVLTPDDYKRVEKEMEERLKQGRPLGQIKPKQIHIIKTVNNQNEK